MIKIEFRFKLLRKMNQKMRKKSCNKSLLKQSLLKSAHKRLTHPMAHQIGGLEGMDLFSIRFLNLSLDQLFARYPQKQ